MEPLQKNARIAGFLYLLVVLAGPFVLLYVPGKLYVAGDAAATVARILEHEALYRAHIVVGLVSQLAFLATVFALYFLLRGVHRGLAGAMVLLILLVAPLAFLAVANELATLTFARGAGFLAVFDEPQRAALVTLLLQFDRQGVYVSELFWGLWLLPLGLLVFRSGFLPRFLGVWLFANGLAYVAMSFTGLLAPEHHDALLRVATPVLFGEVALMLWLLLVGARARPRRGAAPPPAPAP